MAVSYGLSQVIGQIRAISGNNVKNDKHAIRQDTVDNAIALMRRTDPKILAYLWMAIEQKRNILLLNDKNIDISQILDVLSVFVPAFHAVLEISQFSNSIDSRPNFISVAYGRRISPTVQLQMAESLMPDRLIFRQSANQYLTKIFELSTLGISFITAAEGNFDTVPLIKILKSKRPRIPQRHLNAVDISVQLKEKDGNLCISRLTEYKWLEKGEMTINNEFVTKTHKGIRLLDNHTLDLKEIYKSKILSERAKLNIDSFESSIEELNKRSEFIKNIEENESRKRGPNFIEYYYEIK